MIATWLKVLLFVGGGATAAVGAAYVTGALDPYLQDETPVLASLPEPPARPLAEEESAASPQADEAPVSDEEETAAEEAVDEDIVVPQFDLVRVEPDGSMVVAGRAAPGATVEVVTGRDVIATATAGPDGDFAAVLEEPLEPGDYQIVLRSTSEDNTVATSVQTAVVAVPDSPDGRVLALVDEPGVPAQLITVPVPEIVDTPAEAEIAELPEGEEAPVARAEAPEEAAETEVAEAEPADEAQLDIATAEPIAEAREDAEIAAGEAAADMDEPAAASSEPSETAVAEDSAPDAREPDVLEDVATGEPATDDVAETALAEEEAAAPAETADAGLPDAAAEEETVVAAPETPAEEEVAVEAAPATTEEEAAAETPSATAEDDVAADTPAAAPEEEVAVETGDPDPTEERVAAAEPEAPAEQEIAALPEPTEPAPPAREAPRVFVEAVEIDGGTVFVAGGAEAGRYVRVYANEILLGETRATEGDRFLIESRRDLPVGDYIIRADLLGSDGSVVARAAVPFEREPGEAIAAVAPPALPRTAEAEPEAAVEEPTEAAPEDLAETEIAPPVEEEVVVEEPETPAETEIATDEPVEPDVTAEVPAEAAPEEDIAEAPAIEPAEPEVTTAEEPASPVETQTTAEEPVEAAPEDVTEADASGPVEEEIATEAVEPESRAEEVTAIEPETEAGQMAAAEPVEETVSPALQRVDGAVIIRRGDNLWRISRRVYGRGVRYSTIYLANQDQIRDPHWIWPGQVFTVPSQTEEGETADLEAIGDQAVDPTEVPGEIIR